MPKSYAWWCLQSSAFSRRRSAREVCVEVDAVAVWVAQLRVALSPEGVPRRPVAPAPSLDGPRVQLVHLGRAVTPEGNGGPGVPGRGLPVGIEAVDLRLGVQQEPEAALQLRLGVTVLGFRRVRRERRTQLAVEPNRPRQVADD